MFLVKRLLGLVLPLITSQLFWFILVQKNWYYWWLLIWIISGSLVLWLIAGAANKKHWASLSGQHLVITIMPAVLLTLVSPVWLQAVLVIFLALVVVLFNYYTYEKFLLKEKVSWWPATWSIILGLNLISAWAVVYGLIEFLNFSVWLSAFFLALFLGFIKYFQEVEGATWHLLSFSSEVETQRFKNAVWFGLITLEIFLAIWLWPIVFYLKAILASTILIFWASRQHPGHQLSYWWKWCLSLIIVGLVLLAGRWF